MVDFEADFNACLDNDWYDLISKYWNIMKTAKGDVRSNALRGLSDQIMVRIKQLPPSEDDVAAHNPTMAVVDE